MFINEKDQQKMLEDAKRYFDELTKKRGMAKEKARETVKFHSGWQMSSTFWKKFENWYVSK